MLISQKMPWKATFCVLSMFVTDFTGIEKYVAGILLDLQSICGTCPHLNLFSELRNSHQMTVSLKDSTFQMECSRRVSTYMKTHILTTYWEVETADNLHFLLRVPWKVKICLFCSMFGWTRRPKISEARESALHKSVRLRTVCRNSVRITNLELRISHPCRRQWSWDEASEQL